MSSAGVLEAVVKSRINEEKTFEQFRFIAATMAPVFSLFQPSLALSTSGFCKDDSSYHIRLNLHSLSLCGFTDDCKLGFLSSAYLSPQSAWGSRSYLVGGRSSFFLHILSGFSY